MKRVKTIGSPSKRLFLILVVTLTLLGSASLVFSLTRDKTASGRPPTIEQESNVSVLIPIDSRNIKGEGKYYSFAHHYDTLSGACSINQSVVEGADSSTAELGWLSVQELDGDSVLSYGKNKGSIAPIRIDGISGSEVNVSDTYVFETDFRFDGTTATETTKGDSSSWMVAFHLANNTTRSSYVDEKFFSLFFVGDLDSDRYFISSAYKMNTLENHCFLTEGYWYNLRVEYNPSNNYYRVYVNDTLIESAHYAKTENGNDNTFAKAYVELRHYVPDISMYLDNTYISVKQ